MLYKEVQQLSQGTIYTPSSMEQHKDHLNYWFDLILLTMIALMAIKRQVV
jgi:hypothetical protein